MKLLGDEWVTENGAGTSIGSAGGQDEAIELARQAATTQMAGSIAVLPGDGTVERTIL